MMKISLVRKRISRLREKLADLPVDTLWIIQPENRRYFSGFKAVDTQLNESSGSLLISQTETLLITDSRYTAEAEKEAVDFDVTTFKQDLIDTLADLASRIGTRKLGFEGGCITWELHQRLSRALKKLSSPIGMRSLKGMPETMREVKDGEEIKSMAASSDLMSTILDRTIEGLKPGLTEKEIAWQIESRARQSGAEDLAFPSIVASGPNSALPHAVPTDRRIRPKEPITLDVGLKLDGYCCDMTRTVFLDRPGPLFRRVYRTVRQAQLAALEKVKPGTETTLPDKTARDIIKEAGFGDYFGHALGHGVGLATHENPRLGPRKPTKLKQGMVVTVEPGIYIPGKGGVRLEEMVVVERQGPKILTQAGHLYDFE